MLKLITKKSVEDSIKEIETLRNNLRKLQALDEDMNILSYNCKQILGESINEANKSIGSLIRFNEILDTFLTGTKEDFNFKVE